MRKITRKALAMCGAVVLVMLPFNRADAQTILRQVIGASGSVSVELSATAGQPAIGPLISSNVNVGQGFWYEVYAPSLSDVAYDATTGYAAGSYPNPFHSSTTIDYHLDQPTHVRLTIRDLLGKTIRVLVDERQESGAKGAVWDGTNAIGNDVGSGAYIYVLETNANHRVGNGTIMLVR